MTATHMSRPAHTRRSTRAARNEGPCWVGTTLSDQRLPSPSLGPPLLSASWSPPLSWAIPFTTAGGVATGGVVVGGAVVGGGGVVVAWAAGVALVAVALEFDMRPSPRARPPATKAAITAVRIPSRLVT